MTRTELERLVGDAERLPLLRRRLSQCRSWQDLLLAAHGRGYGVQRSDLVLAIREARAGAFLERARVQPIPDLLQRDQPG